MELSGNDVGINLDCFLSELGYRVSQLSIGAFGGNADIPISIIPYQVHCGHRVGE